MSENNEEDALHETIIIQSDDPAFIQKMQERTLELARPIAFLATAIRTLQEDGESHAHIYEALLALSAGLGLKGAQHVLRGQPMTQVIGAVMDKAAELSGDYAAMWVDINQPEDTIGTPMGHA